MKSQILNLDEFNKQQPGVKIDSEISFEPFIEFLKERIKKEKTIKVKFYQMILDQLHGATSSCSLFSINNICTNTSILELVYATLSSTREEEELLYWGLSVPLSPVIFYSTDSLYNLLYDSNKNCVKTPIVKSQQSGDQSHKIAMMYGFLLQKFYHFDPSSKDEMIHALEFEHTSLVKYYKMNLDTRFIKATPKGPLPEIDFTKLDPDLRKERALEVLMKKLPLSMFKFEGFSVITLQDVTANQSVEQIKSLIINKAAYKDKQYFNLVIQQLKNLSGNTDVNFGLLPILKVNGKLVFSEESSLRSVLSETGMKEGVAESLYLSMAEKYFKDPKIYFYKCIDKEHDNPLLKLLHQNGIVSYSLIPVFYNSKLAGVLEIYSRKDNVINEQLLANLDPVLPLLAQMLQNTIEEFGLRINDVLRDQFTSLQPAVQWKFYDVAWQYLQESKKNKNAPIKPIIFKNVQPLYGAIDIRNSTIERNLALRKDLQTHFELLVDTLESMKQQVNLSLLDEVIFKSKKWLNAFHDFTTAGEEITVDEFVTHDIIPLMQHFKHAHPSTIEVVDHYLDAINETDGVAFEHRRQLEKSMQTINGAVNQYLELFGQELQQSYPVYFEKFRTDGVDYDIYIGQSIAPDKPFDQLYLKNLRLWQLKSMAAIAQITHLLMPDLHPALETTQLIFAHANTIDISFRQDEKRFDVEGAYNIRYQIIKKRIDKIHVQSNGERLTQPGKIAIIYANHKEAEEYIQYIHFLQEQKVLHDDLEELDLEDLQGVKGLKALRVGIKYNTEKDPWPIHLEMETAEAIS